MSNWLPAFPYTAFWSMIIGESGIGKSEAALELIKRGHRLVTDDVVEIRKVSEDTLIGTAPDITKHFIELRGIGIVDVKTLFGVSSVKETQNIDLVLKLSDWNKDTEYDRLGIVQLVLKLFRTVYKGTEIDLLRRDLKHSRQAVQKLLCVCVIAP